MVERHYRLKEALATAMLLVTLGGCAASQPGASPGRDAAAGSADGMSTPTMGAAGESLLLAGGEQRRAGDLGQASMTLERALRIEPHQPALWLELARVRLDEGNFGQAEQLAYKANSLAPADSPLAESIRAVIDEARRGQGQMR